MLERLKIFSRSKIIKPLITIYCLFIVASVVYVMLCAYEPIRNSINALCSVCMDVICMLIILIFIGDLVYGKELLRRTSKLFLLMLLASMWALFLDFLNWAYDGLLSFDNITCLFTIGSLCMGSLLVCIFCVYIYSYLSERHGFYKMRKVMRGCVAVNVISHLITLTLALTRTAFEFVDGHYETGGLYDIVTLIPVVTLLFVIVYMICNHKTIGVSDIIAVAGYIVIMIAGALVESTFTIGTTYAAVSIANIFIFVMIQNQMIEQERENAQKWMRRSNTDELTGLNNRHAYEADMSLIEAEPIDEDFVYVSVDANGLKKVNDSLGHIAGDELLVGVSECLKECLSGYGKLYRIGGDEFVAMIYVDSEQICALRERMNKAMNSWHGEKLDRLTFAYGFATVKYDRGLTLRQLAILADQRMYEDKKQYYKINQDTH